MEETQEGDLRGGDLEVKINLMESGLEEVKRLRRVGKYSSRHRGESEEPKCDKCTYQHGEAASCPAEDRTCNVCKEIGHFAMFNL